MIRSDSHYVIGHQHATCQDYCEAGDNYVFLSDGCSIVLDANGKPMEAHTDIGSRLMVRAAARNRSICESSSFLYSTVLSAMDTCDLLQLGPETISATLLGIRVFEHDFGFIVSGDGIIAARDRVTGKWWCYTYRYTPRPFYPRYGLLREAKYNRQVSDLVLTVESTYGVELDSKHIFSGDGDHVITSVVVTREECDLVVIMSDGAFSFLKNGVTYCGPELMTRLLDLRNPRGRFVLRNLTGILRELAQDGIVNQDDISMAAIYDDGK